MREIKFRAWDGKQMYLPEYSDHENFCIQADGTITKYQEVGYERHLMQFILGDNWFLMQYTGLKDKNGKEIYEGDILYEKYIDSKEEKGYGETFVKVAYKDGAFGWIGDITGNFSPFFNEPLNDFEVIGNIYENHELCSQLPT